MVQLIRSTEGLHLVSEYMNAEEAIGLLRDKPDIVIVDIKLPGLSGVDLITRIRHSNETIQFLVCSSYDDDENIFAALESGAAGYILKDYNSTQIIEAIRELSQGGSPMSPYIARRVISSFQRKPGAFEGLITEREKQILDSASKGLMYKEIAENLGISRETVKRHMKNIYQKLHVQNRIEAINKFRN